MPVPRLAILTRWSASRASTCRARRPGTVVAVARGDVGARPGVELHTRAADGALLDDQPTIDVLAVLLASLELDLVAIDAPLSLPHVVVCAVSSCPRCAPSTEEEVSYTQRSADQQGSWKAIGHTEKPPMPMVLLAAIAFRGISLRRLLMRQGLNVIETWPAGVVRALGGASAMPSKRKEPEEYVEWCRHALEGAGFRCPKVVATPDEVDAVVTAVAAWEHLAGRTVAVGEEPEGRIWVPLRDAEKVPGRVRHA